MSYDDLIGREKVQQNAVMTAFENIKPGSGLRGFDTSGLAEIVQITRFGPDALNVVFRVDGCVDQRLVMRGEEIGFEVAEPGRTYAFDADGGLLRLASEAYRVRLAYRRTALGNFKTPIVGTYGAMREKAAPRYLAEFECRFNRRCMLAKQDPSSRIRRLGNRTQFNRASAR
jgi:hypothetical protein